MTETSTRASTAVLIAAAASAGAGLVHGAAAGSHDGETTLMWLLALTAAAQLAWAAAAVLKPHRWILRVGVLLNGSAVLAWVLSRTVGLFGPLAGVDAVGNQDLLAAVLASIATGAALVGLFRAGVARPANSLVAGLAAALMILLAGPGMAAEHSHGHDDPSANAHDEAAAPDHADRAQPAEGAGHAESANGAGDPFISIADSRLTKQQRQRATDLLVSTRVALAKFPDEHSLVAAGYRSIGDGRRPGSFEHFVNTTFMRDGRELDANAIESVVMQKQLDGTKTIASAMYILESGKTMADVPEVAGALTPWHDHQNLCWDETGTRLTGVVVDGKCVPGGTFRPTAPMLHVWATDTPCGPFTGIEGHGGGTCEHSHAS